MSTVERDVTAPAELVERLAEAEEELQRLREQLAEWEQSYADTPERDALFSTVSGQDVKPLYSPLDRSDSAPYEEALGVPGSYPFTRGPYTTMYRTRLWTMRQFAGFATAEETNERYKYLLAHGQTGLSVAFDFPTLMGYDSDHERSLGEVGVCGVAISSAADMERLFDGIPLDQVSVSMTINGPAIILFCFYVAAAERQGVSPDQLRGTVQNDILKEYQAQHAWVFPPEPALGLIVDMFEWCADNAPKYNPISISGYHIREAGATAGQELAFTLRNGFEYVERGIARGLDVDSFAPRLSFFFDVHNDFFEEIAKFRAARKIWAHVMRDRFGAKNPRSWQLRFHAQTAGVSLTAQQPRLNLVRTAIQAMAAVAGGAQSLHTNSLDEAYALPTEETALLALRTQQVLAFETGIAETPDPFAGSYFLERLTLDFEKNFFVELATLDAKGGMVAAVEQGYPQAEIARSAYQQQRAIEDGDRLVVGLNAYVEEEPLPIETLSIDPRVGQEQSEKLAALRAKRDSEAAEAALEALRRAARGSENLMPPILRAVRAYATVGEICDLLREVFGRYEESPSI